MLLRTFGPDAEHTLCPNRGLLPVSRSRRLRAACSLGAAAVVAAVLASALLKLADLPGFGDDLQK